MSSTNSPGFSPEQDPLSTMPEPPRLADPLETPAPGEVTAPQLQGLGDRGPSPPTPGFPEVPGYELTGELARGGMGVVYAARETALGREVALKTLLSCDTELAFQFDREARITARLPHPGIPPVHALGTLPDGRPYLTMKLIRGRTLAAILAAREALRSQSIADLDPTRPDAPGMLLVFEQICQAVAFAHSQGIIHRDLKPQNIMVGPFGEVQVMDWGLARVTKTPAGELRTDDSVDFLAAKRQQGEDEPIATRHGTAKGTPSYMPPEQARGEWDRVDTRADVFALGGILCVMLTGSAPYVGASLREVMGLAVSGNLEATFARLDGCGTDPRLSAIARWCLSVNPAARPPDAQTVAALVELYRLGQEDRARESHPGRAEALDSLVRWSAIRAETHLSSAAQAAPIEPPTPRGRWLLVLVALALGTALALGLILTST